MDMIWHNDVTPDANSSTVTLLSETNQFVMHQDICEQSATLMCVEGDKIQWWLIPLKDLMQSQRLIRHGGLGILQRRLWQAPIFFLHKPGVATNASTTRGQI